MDELAARADAGFESSPANALTARARLPEGHALLVKPLTMMNLSGEAVGALLRYYKLDVDALLVVADDAALPLGRLRARARGSAGGHNGFKSVSQQLGTDEWARLRVGTGRGDERRDMADHVLSRFDPDERPIIDEAIKRAADAAGLFVAEGIEPVMNRFNASPAEEGSDPEDLSETKKTSEESKG
jgi:PTH1 family peptidyl-tRNA hydrolase